MEVVVVIAIIVSMILILWVRQLSSTKKKLESLNTKEAKEKNQLSSDKKRLEREVSLLKEEILKLQRCIQEKDKLYETVCKENENSVLEMSSLYTDHLMLQYEISSKNLLSKKHPALWESLRIDELRKKTEEYLVQYNQLRYRYDLILKRFPELKDVAENVDAIKTFSENFSVSASEKIRELTETIKTLEEAKSTQESRAREELLTLHEEINNLKRGIKEKDDFFKSLRIEKNSISRISSLYSDFLLLEYDISSEYLSLKNNPAYEEAKRIRDLKTETKLHIMRYRQMLYKYEYLLQLFPELTNYVDDFDSIKQLEEIESIENLQEDYDRVQDYVSKNEYANLSIDKRNQLALDRYLNGQKSKWQIGRDYELFCGMQYEKAGWNVEYIGMEKKLNDMGRDLIAIRGEEHNIIQCKYWSQEKVIHEKHIAQLFGTTIMYSLNQPKHHKVVPVFMTNIMLSEAAKEFAKELRVVVKEKIELSNFPRIKCNVNVGETGEKTKIYHLPFDQQYDRTKISKGEEFYAFTVKEAVDAGFRRAFRHFAK